MRCGSEDGNEANGASWSEEQPGRPTIIRTDWVWTVNVGVTLASVSVETVLGERSIITWELSV